jgi:hypothetical protein
MSDKSKTIFMIAGFGLLAFAALNMMKGGAGQRFVMPSQASNKNPRFSLNLPNLPNINFGSFGTGTGGGIGGLSFQDWGMLGAGEANLYNPGNMSIDPSVFDVAGGMSTANGYFVPTGLGAETALW